MRTNPPCSGESADPDRWKALAVCLISGFMTLLDVSIVNVALPTIQTGLGAGDNAHRPPPSSSSHASSRGSPAG